MNADEHYNHISAANLELSSFFVPLREQQPRKPKYLRIPSRLTRLKKLRWDRYIAARSTHGRRSPTALTCYSEVTDVNNQIRSTLLSARDTHELQLVKNIKQKPKAFHAYVRQKKNTINIAGPLINDGVLKTQPRDVGDTFCDAFYSVFTTDDPNLLPLYLQVNLFGTELSTVTFTATSVAKNIQAMSNNTSMGPDHIHPRLLKECCTILAPILARIFNLSMSTGIVPEIWKLSSVIPIYKKGARTIALNYRPINLTCLSSKLMERDIVDDIHVIRS